MLPLLRFEIDEIDKENWDNLISQFDDASIYQTWAYAISSGKSLSHIVLKEGEKILGCCQVELKCSPIYKIGIADIHWGPLCVNKEGSCNPDVLLLLLREIKKEYAIRRGYYIRIWPHTTGDRKEFLKQILESEGFNKNLSQRPYRTFILDLSQSVEDLRKNFLQKWRNCLNKAEKNGLKVVEGTSEELYNIFLKLLSQMVERKQFNTLVNYQEYRRIQMNLPEPLKMKIMICEADGEAVCAAICSAIGDTGIYLFGATGEKALKLNGAYLLQWHMIQWMKGNGIHYYDLGAFNPELNPGVYHFKKGIAGKNGWEETFLGEYHGCFNFTGRAIKIMLGCANALGGIAQKIKNYVKRPFNE